MAASSTSKDGQICMLKVRTTLPEEVPVGYGGYMPWSSHVFMLDCDGDFARRLEKKKNFHCVSKKINDETSEIFYNTTQLKFPDLMSLQGFLRAVRSGSAGKVKHSHVTHTPQNTTTFGTKFGDLSTNMGALTMTLNNRQSTLGRSDCSSQKSRHWRFAFERWEPASTLAMRPS